MNPVQPIPAASNSPRSRPRANANEDEGRFDLAMGQAAAAHIRTQTPTTREAVATDPDLSQDDTPLAVEHSADDGEGGESPSPKSLPLTVPVLAMDLQAEAAHRGMHPQPAAPPTDADSGRRIVRRPAAPVEVIPTISESPRHPLTPERLAPSAATATPHSSVLPALAAVASPVDRPLPEGLTVRVLASRIIGENPPPARAVGLTAAPAANSVASTTATEPVVLTVGGKGVELPGPQPGPVVTPVTEEPWVDAVAPARVITPQPAAPPLAEDGRRPLIQPHPVAPPAMEPIARRTTVPKPVVPPIEEAGHKPQVVRQPPIPVPVATGTSAIQPTSTPGPIASMVPIAAAPRPQVEAKQAPLDTTAPAATVAVSTTVDGSDAGSQTSGGGQGASERASNDTNTPTPSQSEPLTVAAAGSGRDGSTTRAVMIESTAVRADGPASETVATDPRLEPMRRAADRVTLRFEGEGGLEGRLRLAVRGETLHASLLSSHEGTLEKLGAEMGTLRQALREQGFADPRLTITDTRTNINGSADAKHDSRTGDERRQGEPSRQKPQGRDERHGGQSSEGDSGRRSPRQGRQGA